MSQTPQAGATGTAPGSQRGWWLLVLSASVALTIVIGVDYLATGYLASFKAAIGPPYQHTEHVQLIKKEVKDTPDAPHLPELLYIGNSHTFGLAGKNKGDPLQLQGGPIVLDALAEKIATTHPELTPEYCLLGYPNFLPYEMLVRTSQLIERGHRPRLAIIGVTFRNLIRDSQLREEVRLALRPANNPSDAEPAKHPEFAEAFAAWLKTPAAGETHLIQEALALDQKRIAAQLEVERLRSLADRWDENLTDEVRKHSTLLAQSAELRGQIMIDYITPLQSIFMKSTDNESGQYDLLANDYKFNRQCLYALLRRLREINTQVVCYYAPERSDMPLMADEKEQQKFCEEFEADMAKLGVVVLDARQTVPADLWGWVNYTRDRSHFVQQGHRLLADFLLQQLEQRKLWDSLRN